MQGTKIGVECIKKYTSGYFLILQDKKSRPNLPSGRLSNPKSLIALFLKTKFMSRESII